MRTLKSILLAGAMLLAIPAFFSSCQEDAPQIDYTMSVTVTNDFSKVVDAINNGTLKNEQAIAQLTAAIDKMNADQQTKLQAIKDVLNSVNATLDAKLAAIEAAMTAQTLSLEGKLALIEDAMKAQTLTLEKKCDALVAAIKGLPDYTAKLAAIETAIKALPNYEAQLKALNTLIEAQNSKLDDQIAALEGIMNAIPDYSNKLSAIENAIKAMPDHNAAINSIKDEITNLVKEVKDGNKSKADALAEIAKKLEELKAAGGSTTVVKDCVDLGLPSGLMWRKYNVGANSEYEKGNYYAWGETVTKQKYDITTYKWVEIIGEKTDYTKYNETDKLTLLQPEDDAATANLGNNYRTPTVKEWEELLAECTWEVATTTNKNNKTVIDYWKVVGPNGNFIILPSTGYYGRRGWDGKSSIYQSALLCSTANCYTFAWINNNTNEKPFRDIAPREFGFSVRPVFEKK